MERVISIIMRANPQLEGCIIGVDTDISADLGLSSLHILVTIAEIEDEYGTRIDPENLKGNLTPSGILSALQAKQ